MHQKIKNHFSLLLIVIFGLVLPLHKVQAVVPLVGAGIAAAVVYIGGWVLQALSFATAGLVSLATAILHWVLYSIPYAYTSGGIVDIGWPIVRDLVNMFFVIILVFIGLSTALRLGGYGTKKMLFSLVMIALLINFTPVIAGLIVDASNIVMNFFVEGLSPGAYFQAHLAAQKALLPASIWEALNPFKNIEQLLGSLILIVLDIVAFIIFGIFALLFLTRYVAIWILVILSPLAFACYILPGTRRIFTQWWNQFIQWCIVGIVAGFFLYLGTQMLGALGEISGSSQDKFTGPVDMMTNLMPLVTLIIFYIIGLFVALSTSAMGAGHIISFGKTAGKKVGGISLGMARGVPAISKAEAAARKRLETIPLLGRAIGGPAAYEREKMKKMTELAKDYEGLPPQEIERVLRMRPLTRNDRLRQAGIVEHLAKRGQLRDEAKAEIVKAVKAVGMLPEEILKKRPDWAPEFGRNIEETLRKQDPEDFRKNAQTEAFKNINVSLSSLLDRAKFDELGKGKMGIRQEIIRTIQNPPAGWSVPPQHESTYQQRLNDIANDPRWPIAVVRGGAILPGTEEFRKTEEEIRRRLR